MHNLEALMGGAAAGGAAGPPPEIQVDPSQHPDSPPPAAPALEEQLQSAIDQIRDAMSHQDVTPVTKLDMQKAELSLQKLIADLHKEQEAALGGGPATNFLRRASGAAS